MTDFDDPRLDMDAAMRQTLALYHQRIEAERQGQGGPHRHMAVGPATGRLINLLAGSLDAPHILELGTSLGYSTIWLADAARATGGRVTTLELEAEKSASAREMAEQAGLARWVD
ncbi:O-methyltransferase [Modicisalibacter radicis]|uniref:O-methyltransferase n=1 Tax=Halomonas sp. EAR18 TaxID=2518972 RepID=UPI001B34B2FF|nr:class I SAM-dependent methyltransferase [Halomonas sp. EAR18]